MRVTKPGVYKDDAGCTHRIDGVGDFGPYAFYDDDRASISWYRESGEHVSLPHKLVEYLRPLGPDDVPPPAPSAETKALRLSVMRALDKHDRLGREGVYALLTTGRRDVSGAWTAGCGLAHEQAVFLIRFITRRASSYAI